MYTDGSNNFIAKRNVHSTHWLIYARYIGEMTMTSKCNVPITFGKSNWISENIIRQFITALRSQTNFNIINLQIIKIFNAEAHTYFISTQSNRKTLYINNTVSCIKCNSGQRHFKLAASQGGAIRTIEWNTSPQYRLITSISITSLHIYMYHNVYLFIVVAQWRHDVVDLFSCIIAAAGEWKM